MVETFILRCPLILAGSSKTVTAIRTLMSVTKPMHPISVFRITDRVKEPVRFTHWTNQTAGNDDSAPYEQQTPVPDTAQESIAIISAMVISKTNIMEPAVAAQRAGQNRPRYCSNNGVDFAFSIIRFFAIL